MTRWVVVASIALLTLLTYFQFPGHTWLQSDMQIYVPILEHLRDSSVLSKDILVERPHVAFTIFDEVAVALARVSNDLLFEAVKRHPGRFAGFATLPTPDPPAAAKELERCVKELAFCGAMVHGSSRGHFLDERPFWPILESAQALDVPIYLHPSTPPPAVLDAYYKEYPVLSRAALGFGIDMAVQAARLVMSGAFDEFPRLKIILGHLGEGLPYVLWRTDDTLARRGRLKRRFADYFRDHFYITTSGNFSQSALQCAIAELGIGRILFAVDWPFVANPPATKWMEGVPLCDEDKAKILSGNAKRLLRI